MDLLWAVYKLFTKEMTTRIFDTLDSTQPRGQTLNNGPNPHTNRDKGENR